MTKAKGHPLEVPADLLSTLLLYRMRQDVHCRPVLKADEVTAVEDALGCAPIPTDVLTVFCAIGRDVRHILSSTEDARDQNDAFSKYLVIATEEEEDDDVPTRWCIPAGPATRDGAARSGGPTRVLCWPPDRKKAPTETRSVSEFVTAHLRLSRATPEELSAVEALTDDFSPRMMERTRQPARTVWHPRFGQGTVVREWLEGNPKLEIDFPGAGRKLVLASYVQEVPAEPQPPKRSRAGNPSSARPRRRGAAA